MSGGRRRTALDLARMAAEAHSNLNTYAAVIAILEGGLIYDGRHARAQQIIAIAKLASAEELRLYDKAVAQLGKPRA